MLLLVTYDVDTTSPEGRQRLQKISKVCLDYGQRVQNSVFECFVDASTARILQAKLLSLIDQRQDSLRLYNLGKHYQSRIQHFGVNPGYDPEGLLIV